MRGPFFSLYINIKAQRSVCGLALACVPGALSVRGRSHPVVDLNEHIRSG